MMNLIRTEGRFMNKIGVIIPHTSLWADDFRKNVLDIAEYMDIDVVFGVGHFDEAVQCAKKLLDDHPDIEGFIARNNTAAYLRRAINLPVSNLELTDFDFVKSIHDLADKSGTFLMFQFKIDTAHFDIPGISRVSGIDLRTVIVDENQGNDYDRIAEEHGCNRVITSVELVAMPCIRGGKKVTIVKISPTSIQNAFRRAQIMIEVRGRERTKADRLRESLNSFKEGFVATDRDGKIRIFNHAMSTIIGVACRDVMGISKQSAMERFSFLKKVFDSNDEDIIEFRDEKYAVNREDVLAENMFIQDLIRVTSIPQIQKMEGMIRQKLAEKGFEARNTFDNIISFCPVMKELKEKARRYAKTASNIFVTGESGTGKELLAQSIHNESSFAPGPFVAINCAALPENLLESELFGYDEGAFTGAKKGGKAGLMELSHGGTLFLDEIGLMPLAIQAKLLRSLQERRICRLGGNRLIPVHNRLICATNRDLSQDVQAGLFREDLYYRIDVLPLTLPPLRERGEDVAHLARIMLEKKSAETGRHLAVPESLLAYFLDYDWPGNVRQLEAFVERIVVLSDGDCVDGALVRHLLDEIRMKSSPTGEKQASTSDSDRYILHKGTLDEMEKQVIQQAYTKFDGNIAVMTRELGIGRTTLWRKLKSIQVA